MEKTKRNIVLVDDHPLIRKGIALTLSESDRYSVIAQLSSAEEALARLPGLDADGAIIDISLTGMNGIELVKHIRTTNSKLKILMVSRHDEDIYAERALRAGANGYIMKHVASEMLAEALEKIFKDGIYVSDSVSAKMLQQAMGQKTTTESPLELLSDRELEVFEQIGRGFSNKDIALKMHVSPKTVETYKTRIKEKMNLSGSHELTREAIQWVHD
ncbi:MAG: response regulator transcription factor [Candidatus Cyclonatronum sp.]|uniref:response regulator transcription factor n=1 Tax=Cyclonatronum sp. TaxID=3024185 RepID=UPI0025BA12D0|nr:response regulator transcription factor [Cyclonatronum sp.]MCC5932936.1 response regulator transcription factor [Balneolales bacterium]MCH8486963.1 response regulator transcription factor [Cyclonatronum sp.]